MANYKKLKLKNLIKNLTETETSEETETKLKLKNLVKNLTETEKEKS